MTIENPIPKEKDPFDDTLRIYVGDEREDCFGSQIPYYLRYGVEYTQKEEKKND